MIFCAHPKEMHTQCNGHSRVITCEDCNEILRVEKKDKSGKFVPVNPSQKEEGKQ